MTGTDAVTGVATGMDVARWTEAATSVNNRVGVSVAPTDGIRTARGSGVGARGGGSQCQNLLATVVRLVDGSVRKECSC